MVTPAGGFFLSFFYFITVLRKILPRLLPFLLFTGITSAVNRSTIRPLWTIAGYYAFVTGDQVAGGGEGEGAGGGGGSPTFFVVST